MKCTYLHAKYVIAAVVLCAGLMSSDLSYGQARSSNAAPTLTQTQDAARSGWLAYRNARTNLNTYLRYAGEPVGVFVAWASPDSDALARAVSRLLQDIHTQMREAEILKSQGRYAEAIALITQGRGLNPGPYVAGGIDCSNLQGVRARAQCASRMATRLRDNLEPGATRAAGATVAAPLVAGAACVSTMGGALVGAVGLEGAGVEALGEVADRSDIETRREQAAAHLAEVAAQGPVVPLVQQPTQPVRTTAAATDSSAAPTSLNTAELRRRQREAYEVENFLAALDRVTPQFRTQEQLVAAARAEVRRPMGVGVLREDAVLFALDAEALATGQAVPGQLANHGTRQARWRTRLSRYREVADAAGRNPEVRRSRVLEALAEDFPGLFESGSSSAMRVAFSGSMASVLDGSAAPNDELRTMIIHAALSQTPRVLGAGEKLGVQVFQDRVSPVVITGSGQRATVRNLSTGEMVTPVTGKYFSPQVIFASFLEKIRGTEALPQEAAPPMGGAAGLRRLAIALPESTPTSQQRPEATRSQVAGAATWLRWPAVNIAYYAPGAAPVGVASVPAPSVPVQSQPPPQQANVSPEAALRPQMVVNAPRSLQKITEDARRFVSQLVGHNSEQLPFDIARFMLEVEGAHLREDAESRSMWERDSYARYQEAARSYQQTLSTIRERIVNITDPERRIEVAMDTLVERHLVRYYRDDAGILNGLTGGPGFNCQGETQIILGTMQALGLTPPDGFQLGVQVFNDHVQAVLYNPNGERGPETRNLLTGTVEHGPINAHIYAPAVALVALLGEQSPRPAASFLIASPAQPSDQQTSRDLSRMGMRNTNLSWPSVVARFSAMPTPEFARIDRNMSEGPIMAAHSIRPPTNASADFRGCRILSDIRSARYNIEIFTNLNNDGTSQSYSSICAYGNSACELQTQNILREAYNNRAADNRCPNDISQRLEGLVVEQETTLWENLPVAVRSFLTGSSPVVPRLTGEEYQSMARYSQFQNMLQSLVKGIRFSPDFINRMRRVDIQRIRVPQYLDNNIYIINLFLEVIEFNVRTYLIGSEIPSHIKLAHLQTLERVHRTFRPKREELFLFNAEHNLSSAVSQVESPGSAYEEFLRQSGGAFSNSPYESSNEYFLHYRMQLDLFLALVEPDEGRRASEFAPAIPLLRPDQNSELYRRYQELVLVQIGRNPTALLSDIDRDRIISRSEGSSNEREFIDAVAGNLGVQGAQAIADGIQRNFSSAVSRIVSSARQTVPTDDHSQDIYTSIAECRTTVAGWARYLNWDQNRQAQFCVLPDNARSLIVARSEVLRTQVNSNPRGVLAAVARLEPREAERILAPILLTQEQLSSSAQTSATIDPAAAHERRYVEARERLGPLLDLLLTPGAVRVGRAPPVRSTTSAGQPTPAQRQAPMELPAATDLGLGDNDIFVFEPPAESAQSDGRATQARRRRSNTSIYIPTRERYAHLLLQFITLTDDPRLVRQLWRPEFKTLLQSAPLSASERLRLAGLP